VDGAWKLSMRDGNPAFEQCGRLGFSDLAGAIAFNVIWNGLVGLGACRLLGLLPGRPVLTTGEWWRLFLLLLPFAIGGLSIFVCFLIQLLEPFRLTHWIMRPDRIEFRTTRFGLPLGKQRAFRHGGVVKATIRDGFGLSRCQSENNRNPGEQFTLAFTDAEQRSICSIECLTLGEARWMKGCLQEHGLLR
jgi:hypothetical protein